MKRAIVIFLLCVCVLLCGGVAFAQDEAADTLITLSDGQAVAEGMGVLVDGKSVFICAAGTYEISGQWDGQLIVSAGKNDLVVLRLAGVHVANEEGPAIYVSNAGLTVIELVDGTRNSVSSGILTSEDSAVDADASGGAIQAKDDLTLRGEGTLEVVGAINNGIHTSNRLRIEGGVITVTAVNNGIKGKDGVEITGGIIDITCEGDGIRSNDTTGEGYGTVDISGGVLNIKSGGDAVQAETTLTVSGGEMYLVAGGGSENAPAVEETMRLWGGRGWDMDDMQEEETASAKGLKSGTDLTLTGGSATIDAMDDALHANGSVTITGGEWTLSTGDDGVHADETLRVEDGVITVLRSYEGLEANQIEIAGGYIQVTATDDGVNANGGTNDGWGGRGWREMESETSESSTPMPNLTISGGEIYINAQGDGLDSNGNLRIEGGLVIVDGPSSSGNGALDSGTENGGICRVNGGTVLAVGSAGMVETFDDESAQCSFQVTFSPALTAGSELIISDENGNVLFSHTLAKEAASVVFSSPELLQGATYHIAAGERAEDITLNGVSTSSGYGIMNRRR